MDAAESVIIYTLFFIPALFSITILVQGIMKIVKQERDGVVGVVFGVIMIALVIGTYVMFIR